jgi:deazaflavin-dependent oxidoreductase (nitroreductase family)
VTAPKGSIKERLSRYREIKLSVTGRKSGRTISIPVWFVLEGEKLYLLPVQGSETQWYKNVLQNPSIRIDARGVEGEFRAKPINGAKTVKSVVEKFREKYGEGREEVLFEIRCGGCGCALLMKANATER